MKTVKKQPTVLKLDAAFQKSFFLNFNLKNFKYLVFNVSAVIYNNY